MPEQQPAIAALSIDYDPDLIIWRFIRDLVRAAYDLGKEAGVMKHLVGATLHRLFPADAQDNPSGEVAGKKERLGDFLVGDTIFHVILSPVMSVYDQCQKNLDQGFRVVLLVPDKYFCGTRQNAEIILPGKIMVASIETCISQNIEHLAGFSKKNLYKVLRQLLADYNQRIKTLESDDSLLIPIPGNLPG